MVQCVALFEDGWATGLEVQAAGNSSDIILISVSN